MTAAGHARSRRDGRPAAPGPRRAGGSRVRPVAGVLLLVVVCALVLAEGRGRAGNREPVLALARPVAAGQVITASDLRVVEVSAAGPVSLVPAWRQAQVAGRTAAAEPAGGQPAGRRRRRRGVPGPGPGVAGRRAGAGPLPAGPVTRAARRRARGPRTRPRRAGAGGRVRGGAVGHRRPVPGAAGETVAVLDLPRDVVPQVAAASAAGRVSLAVIPAGR